MAEYIEREAFLKDIEKRYCLPCKEAGKDHNGCKCDVCWVEDLYGETLRRWCAAKTASIGRTITMAIRTRNADGGTGKRRTPMTFAVMENKRTVIAMPKRVNPLWRRRCERFSARGFTLL